MNKEWSLDVLYKGYDDPKFAADEARMDELIAEFTEFSKDPSGDPAEVLKKAITMEQELTALMSDLFEFAMLRMSTNSSDVESKAAAGRLARKRSGLAAPETALTNYIAGLEDLDAVIGEDELLKEHEFFLKSIKDDAIPNIVKEITDNKMVKTKRTGFVFNELKPILIDLFAGIFERMNLVLEPS